MIKPQEKNETGILPCSKILWHEKQLWLFLAISTGGIPAIEQHEDQDGSDIIEMETKGKSAMYTSNQSIFYKLQRENTSGAHNAP